MRLNVNPTKVLKNICNDIKDSFMHYLENPIENDTYWNFFFMVIVTSILYNSIKYYQWPVEVVASNFEQAGLIVWMIIMIVVMFGFLGLLGLFALIKLYIEHYNDKYNED